MAKESMKAREVKRQKLVARYAAKRAALKEAGDSFRKTFITNTLKSTGGNRTKAAKILDVQRSYLSRLIKELQID